MSYISALGVIHRAVLKLGPPHFHGFFSLDPSPPRRSCRFAYHDRQLADPFWSFGRNYLQRSVFGYIWVYNMLPQYVVQASSVKLFQRALNSILRMVAGAGVQDWEMLFCPQQERNTCTLKDFLR